MSVRACMHCRRFFWALPLFPLPRGYCGFPCWELRRKTEHTAAPPEAERIQRQIRQHRINEHGSDSPLDWYDCMICDRLEAAYADSLSYHALLEAARSQSVTEGRVA